MHTFEDIFGFRSKHQAIILVTWVSQDAKKKSTCWRCGDVCFAAQCFLGSCYL